MKRPSHISLACVLITLAAVAVCQEQTVARLNHEATPDIPHSATETRISPAQTSLHHSAPLPESPLARQAANALFVKSDLSRARSLASRALQRDRRDGEALFLLMEVAGMQADQAEMLDAAVRLCEVGGSSPDDPRVRLAAVRLRESAANTPEFRRLVPRLQALLANSSALAPDLQAALLEAAMDGVSGLDPYAISRASGIVTDWRIVGPLGRHSLLDFEQELLSPNTDLAQASYQNRWVENFQFSDGRIRLPDYLSHHGFFYAAGHFAALTPGSRMVTAESDGMLEVFVDGRRVLRADAGRNRTSASVNVSAGPHRVLVKFTGPATPLCISISQVPSQIESPSRTKLSTQELTYLLAAEGYAAHEFGAAISQINAVPSSGDSAALQFLLAQSWDNFHPTASEASTAWRSLRSLAPCAFAADLALASKAARDGDSEEAVTRAKQVLAARPANLEALEIVTSPRTETATAGASIDEDKFWARRIAAHPSCAGLLGGIRFYRSRGELEQANSVRQRLDGCAPESLAYAQLLSEQGSHAEAAQCLKQLVSAAPLSRAARLMLIRELQLAGDDAVAQLAAAEWLQVAPNAESYHRLAADQVEATGNLAEKFPREDLPFYAGYRRDAVEVVGEIAGLQGVESPVTLLEDHVAIARADGSVSLYVHTTRLLTAQAIDQPAGDIPQGAQILQLRVIHSGGTVSAVASAAAGQLVVSPGDAIDQEYVYHYAGDGGISEHSEAFQFVFGSFDGPVLSARFVALTPAAQADRGVVIATGEAPRMSARVHNGMLARVWQKDISLRTNSSSRSMAIVRVLEQENGWSVPSNAEHQRRIDTIHRGPHLEDSAWRQRPTAKWNLTSNQL